MSRRTKIIIGTIVIVVLCLLDAAGVCITDPRFEAGKQDRAQAARILEEASTVH